MDETTEITQAEWDYMAETLAERDAKDHPQDVIVPGNIFDPNGRSFLPDGISLPRYWRLLNGVVWRCQDAVEKEAVWLLEE